MPCRAQFGQESTRLAEGWEFLRGDLGGVWEAVRPWRPTRPEAVPLWTPVTLPHCFNALDAVDPEANYYQGPGWYRTALAVDNPYPGGRTLLHFEGAGQRTQVYIYTTLVCEHTGGYDEFTVDITDAVRAFLAGGDAERFEGRVPVSVRADNSRDLETIPSDMSDFNLYGGIYRHLNLVYAPALYIDGVQIDTAVDPDGTAGELKLFVSVAGEPGTGHRPAGNTAAGNTVAGELPAGTRSAATLRIRIEAPDGATVCHEEVRVGGTGFGEVLSLSVDSPALWSPAEPSLYTVTLTLISAAGEHTVTDRFGFRRFEFVERGPFLLNGERLLLKGVHRHEDHAGVAAAMTDEMVRREMRQIKEMGANFIRLGHYQQSRLVLGLCDELGILVWEEIPWCRGGLGGEEYRAQGRRMLRNMISQHRNHPSVILWGLGNENDWPGDFEEFDREAIRAYMQELHDLSHELDPSRLTAIRRCGFCEDIVDVYSPSIWAGWYKGAYVDYRNATHAEMLGTDRFLHVEWGADSHPGRYSEDPHTGITYSPHPPEAEIIPGWPVYTDGPNNSTMGDWSETYAAELIDWTLGRQHDMPWLTGSAYWSFKDFSTPLRPENPVPYVNQKGLVERDGTPKEGYYIFQSYWAAEPMVRIFGHGWRVRWGAPGEVKRLLVYSNCDEAELFLNGESLGVRRRTEGDFPANGLRWDTPLREGGNHLRAVARRDDCVLTDEMQFEYTTALWGEPARIDVATYPAGEGAVWVEARLLDRNGVQCHDARDYIQFELAGDGRLVRLQGTASGSHIVQAHNGWARIKVETGGGESVVAVRSEGMETAFVTIGD